MILFGCGSEEWGFEEDSFAGKAELTQEQTTLISRMKTRHLEFIKNFKRDLSVGERFDGFLGEPDEPSDKMKDAAYAEQVREIISQENRDRKRFYELEVGKMIVENNPLITEKTIANVDKKIEEAMIEREGSDSKTVHEQVKAPWYCEDFFTKFLFWLPCDEIESEIDKEIAKIVDGIMETVGEGLHKAKDPAIKASLEMAMKYYQRVFLAAVQKAYAEYWQKKLVKPGEWIQTKADEWQYKSE